MWSPKEHLYKLAQSLRSARTVSLPDDKDAAARYLTTLVIGSQHKSFAELLDNSNFDVNYAFGRVQRNLLQIAANVGSFECLCIMLRHGSDPNYQDISGSTALHLAARNGKRRCVQKLLEYKANPEMRNNEGLTMIHWLAMNGRVEILSDVLPHVNNLEAEDVQGQTALHVASQNGHKSTVVCLLEAGADVNKANHAGLTALHFACSRGQRDTAAPLLTKGALHLQDKSGDTPLIMCLRGGYGATVQLLLQHFPRLMNTLVLCAVKLMDMRYESVVTCFRHLCSLPSGQETLIRVSEFAADSGFQLLSVSSDYSTRVCCFKSAIELLSVLCDGLHPAEEIFHPLEGLWASLEEWMLVLQQELATDRMDVQQNSDQAVETGPDLSEKGSDPQDGTAKNSDRRDVFGATHDRICAIIQGFNSSMQSQNAHVLESVNRFTDFVKRHHNIIEHLIEKDANVIFEHFSFLLDSTELVQQFLPVVKKQPFEERYDWFYGQLHSKRMQEAEQRLRNNNGGLPNPLQVRRDHVFEDSCAALEKQSSDSLKFYLSVLFQDEQGMGAGVLREWFDVLSNEICNPEYALFTQSDDGCTFQPNCNSAVNPDHLNYFRFAGQILGMALYHKQLVNVYFTRSFYKHILGIPVDYMDVSSIDPEYAKNLQWILDNDISELGLGLSFTVETDVFGSMQEIELKPGGGHILVTEENKSVYVQLVTELRMTRAIQPQIDSFRQGFNSFIPQSLIQIFSEDELELLLSGLSEIDVEDWRTHTAYSGGYSETHDVIKWFWQCVDEMDNDDKVHLLQFTTGCCRVPHKGFSQLQTAGGRGKFVITYVPYHDDELPTASTCINMLKLPDYPSSECLKEKLLVAVRCGSQGYAKT